MHTVGNGRAIWNTTPKKNIQFSCFTNCYWHFHCTAIISSKYTQPRTLYMRLLLTFILVRHKSTISCSKTTENTLCELLLLSLLPFAWDCLCLSIKIEYDFHILRIYFVLQPLEMGSSGMHGTCVCQPISWCQKESGFVEFYERPT